MTVTLIEHDDLFIGGRWITASSSQRTEVVSPATEEIVARLSVPTTKDAEAAVAAARDAFDNGPWPRLTIAERADVIGRFGEVFESRSTEWAAAWTAESGPTQTHAAMLNTIVAGLWRDVVEQARTLPATERRELPDGTVDVVREPYGVAVTVTTWNGPALYLVAKVVPALLAGCSVIVKTAYESQLTARLIGEFAAEAGLPEGVLSVLAAPTEVSEFLVAHPQVDKVSLTGSVAAGRQVMAACAANLTPVTLELGGKSPAVIADDIPLDRVLPTLLPAFFMYSGQICVALTRLLVPAHRHDEVVDAVVAGLSALRVGAPDDPETVIGPLGTRAQYEKVLRYIEYGKAEGAKLVLGGGRPAGLDRGYYLEPTVFTGVTPEMRIAREEIFGPVLSVITYSDIDDAVRIANSTEYGLAGTVYAEDEELARSVAGRIRSGSVAINCFGPSLFAPFGGYKHSGIGRENGVEGITEFLQTKSIKIS
ncbi:aldehyde dehydrogenase [Streptomyces sp. NBC_00988]|uniref:aldehyde dehydrogenase n=1 Tax=Streptomyces sp. NBC_00988 TaxID=2903704 RepID=UPI00386D69FA|nr:aldehyde dehydrogenase [Streptomyces sp. NBC_00988]